MNLASFDLPADTWPDDSTSYQTPKRGMIISVFLQAPISGLSYVTPQITYVQKGTRTENISFDVYANGQYQIVHRGSIQVDADFIELSTKFVTKFGPTGIKLCPAIGPVIGINLSNQVTYEFFSQTSPDPRGTLADQPFTSPIELGLELGMALEIAATKKASCLLNLGYTLGLTDYGQVYGLPQGILSTRGTQISVGMLFAL
jgi:hypothetical protein